MTYLLKYFANFAVYNTGAAILQATLTLCKHKNMCHTVKKTSYNNMGANAARMMLAALCLALMAALPSCGGAKLSVADEQ